MVRLDVDARPIGGRLGDHPRRLDCSSRTAQPLDATWTVMVGGTARTTLVHVPASYDPTVPTPVVIDLHGLGGDGAMEAALTSANAKSDTAGFISVHPNGATVTGQLERRRLLRHRAVAEHRRHRLHEAARRRSRCQAVRRRRARVRDGHVERRIHVASHRLRARGSVRRDRPGRRRYRDRDVHAIAAGAGVRDPRQRRSARPVFVRTIVGERVGHRQRLHDDDDDVPATASPRA